MINKASDISLKCRIYDLICSGLHEICACRILIHVHSFLSQIWIDWDYLTHILHYEGTFLYKFSCKQTPTLELRLHRVHVSILMKLKLLILAIWSTRASPRTTLKWHYSIETWFSTVPHRLMLVAPTRFPSCKPFTRAYKVLGFLIVNHISFALKVFILS